MNKFAVFLVIAVAIGALAQPTPNLKEVNRRIGMLRLNLTFKYETNMRDLDKVYNNLKNASSKLLQDSNLLITNQQFLQNRKLIDLKIAAIMQKVNISSCLAPYERVLQEFEDVSILEVGDCIGKLTDKSVSLYALTQTKMHMVFDTLLKLNDVLINCPNGPYNKDRKCVDKIEEQVAIHEQEDMNTLRAIYEEGVDRFEGIFKRLMLCGVKEAEIHKEVTDELVGDISHCVSKLVKPTN